MLGVIDLFNDSLQQPCLGVPLHEDFLSNLGAPAMLTVPLGEERAFDWSSNFNHGTLNGGITTTPGGGGTLGSAWKCDGTTGYVNCGSVSSATVTKLTLGGVIYSPASGSNFYLGWGDTNSHRANISTDSTHIYWQIENGAFNFPSCSNTLTGYHLLTLVYDGSGSPYITAYIDGARQTISASNMVSTYAMTGTFSIGREPANAGRFSSSGVQHLAAFAWPGIAFTAAQVSSLYSCLRTGEPFPLFQPQSSAIMMGTAVAAGSKVPWPLFFGRAA